ncbi:MAG: hypothetical protein MJ033_01525 [Victivallaceae bacterium]|nr:hypothetical protein [Victivallaceae bacterium]
MMSVSQFREQIYFNYPAELYGMLNRALAERGATADSSDYFHLAKSSDDRALLERLYDKLMKLSRYFLVDPEEINLSNILSNSMVCYNLPLLAQKSDRPFLVPITANWRNSYDLSIPEYHWPWRSTAVSTTLYPRPHMQHRRFSEYFLQAAEMMKHLRYYAPNALGSFIDIPACAAGASCSHIYLIRADGSYLENSNEFQFQQLWNGYLAPGRYRLDFFDETTSREFPLAAFAGYVDLYDNLQYFTQ